jgi:hypothetical protein
MLWIVAAFSVVVVLVGVAAFSYLEILRELEKRAFTPQDLNNRPNSN